VNEWISFTYSDVWCVYCAGVQSIVSKRQHITGALTLHWVALVELILTELPCVCVCACMRVGVFIHTCVCVRAPVFTHACRCASICTQYSIFSKNVLPQFDLGILQWAYIMCRQVISYLENTTKQTSTVPHRVRRVNVDLYNMAAYFNNPRVQTTETGFTS
jgi:hypothetical protein